MAYYDLEKLAEELKLTLVAPPKEGGVVKGCYLSDLLSWVLAKGTEGDLWLTVMGHVNVVAVAGLKGFSAVVVCDGAPLDPEAQTSALAHGVALYTSPLPLYELGVKVSHLLQKEKNQA